jgi:hypothetical protein
MSFNRSLETSRLGGKSSGSIVVAVMQEVFPSFVGLKNRGTLKNLPDRKVGRQIEPVLAAN